MLMMVFLWDTGIQIAMLPCLYSCTCIRSFSFDPGWLRKSFLCGSLCSHICPHGWAITPLLLKGLGFIGALFEFHLKGLSWQDISSAILGLIVGLLIANLIAVPFFDLPVGSYIAVVLNIVLGYLGARIFWKRQEDIRGVFNLGALKERLTTRKIGVKGVAVKRY